MYNQLLNIQLSNSIKLDQTQSIGTTLLNGSVQEQGLFFFNIFESVSKLLKLYHQTMITFSVSSLIKPTELNQTNQTLSN